MEKEEKRRCSNKINREERHRDMGRGDKVWRHREGRDSIRRDRGENGQREESYRKE